MNPSELSDRELDAAVAKEVMGWRRSTRQWAGFKRGALLERNKEFCHQEYDQAVRYIDKHGVCRWVHALPAYSTDPRAMMEVVKRMRSLGFSGLIEWLADEGSEIADVVVSINHDDFEWPEAVEGSKIERTYAEAALLAVRAQKGEGE